MDMLSHLRGLYDYDFWATARVIDCLRAMPDPPNEAMRQIAHYLLARRAWLLRLIEGGSFGIELWPVLPAGRQGLAVVEELSAATEAELNSSLTGISEEELYVVVSYLSYERTEESRRLLDILLQMVNHASYHRGFAAAEIRRAGGRILATDYINYAARLA